MKKLYKAPLEQVPTFVYQDWQGDGTITHVGDLDSDRYYLVDDDVPLPKSDHAEFTAVDITTELAERLRPVTFPNVVSFIQSAEERIKAARAVINAERDQRLTAGVQLDGNSYNSDDRFLAVLHGMVLGFQAGTLTGKQDIRTQDNHTVQLDQAAIGALTATVEKFRSDVFAWSWAQKDALT